MFCNVSCCHRIRRSEIWREKTGLSAFIFLPAQRNSCGCMQSDFCFFFYYACVVYFIFNSNFTHPSRGNFLLRISISITTMFVILSIDYILMVVFCWIYGGDQFSIAFNVFMTPGPLRCLYLILDKITDIALYMAARKYLSKLSELKSRWLITLLFSGSLVYLITQILFRAILSEDYIQLYRASILSFLILILFFATLFLLLLNTSAREHENVQNSFYYAQIS